MALPTLRFKDNDGSEFPKWQQKRFGDIMECYSGGTPLASEKRYYGGHIPFLKSGEIHSSSTKSNLTKLGLSSSSAKMVKKGDILFSLYRETNCGDVDLAKIDAAINQAILCIVPHKDDRAYLMYWLQRSRSAIKAKYITGPKDSLSAKIVKSLIVPIPSIAEQHKIADLLLTVDSVIDKQQAEITTWEQYKKGVAQKLFNQEVRFKADDGSDFPAWDSMNFGNVFEEISNNTLARVKLSDESGQAKNIHYGDIHTKFGEILDLKEDAVPFIIPEVDCSRMMPLQDGDIVIADTAEDNTVGKAVEVHNVGSNILYAGLHTIARRPKFKFAPKYLGYYIPYMQGTKLPAISKAHILLTHIAIPSPQEQRKIAECLDAINDVIALSKAELEKWRELKQGLLQQLFV